jgi:uncharacterized protein (DUF1684 family)
MMRASEWEASVKIQRRYKDEFFKLDEQSPIPYEDRDEFQGLRYYPPDFALCFELELHEHPEKKTLELEDTKGSIRHLLRWGEFRFDVKGVACTLQVYKSSPQDDHFFLPFRDTTSGKQTYGAGRYLDLEADRSRLHNGHWVLDFNEAYNPWCAYSNDYACPLTPSENWLKVAIEAGEMSYDK